MENYLDIGGAVFAIPAAIFWFLSAYGKLPPMVAYWDFTPENDPFFQAIKFSANMNAIAATLSGLSAVCMALKLFFQG